MTAIKVWVVDYGREHFVLQWKDPSTGKRKSKSSGCRKKRDAERAAALLEGQLNARQPKGDGSTLWTDFVDEYEDSHLQSLAKSSLDRSMTVFNVFAAATSPKHLSDITGSVLSTFAASQRLLGRSEATIATSMRTLRAALLWAKANGYIADVPPIPKQSRAKKTRAKGRPLTDKEFIAFLRAVRTQKDMQRLDRVGRRTWRRLIIGLWLSGLRLDEALALTWQQSGDHGSTIWIDTSGKYPLLGVSAESEKGNTDRLLPITPDFGRWLLKIPQDKRTGFVFPLKKSRQQDIRRMDTTSKILSKIGEESKVKVNSDGKFASAHDLRRSFGLRWASRVFPAELQTLMRHSDIGTTMGYYAIVEATAFASKLWNLPSSTTRDTTGKPENP